MKINLGFVEDQSWFALKTVKSILSKYDLIVTHKINRDIDRDREITQGYILVHPIRVTSSPHNREIFH